MDNPPDFSPPFVTPRTLRQVFESINDEGTEAWLQGRMTHDELTALVKPTSAYLPVVEIPNEPGPACDGSATPPVESYPGWIDSTVCFADEFPDEPLAPEHSFTLLAYLLTPPQKDTPK